MRKLFLSIFIFATFTLGIEVQKPRVYKNDHNISSWMMSEKLDGIRGYWDGSQLLTKNGNIIHTPKWFTKNFPPFELDGELWSGRDDFEFVQSTVLDENPSKNWRKITYNIFEAPNAKGDFLQRLETAKEWFIKHPNDHVKIIKQIKCRDEAHLQSFLKKVVKLNGEGVIVKDPKQGYHTGRSPYILKVKKTYDMEGIVTGHNLRQNGTLKSLVVKLENGVVFNLGGGFTKTQRDNPVKVGETVTFKYYGFTKNGKPKFTSFLRVRKAE